MLKALHARKEIIKTGQRPRRAGRGGGLRAG
jgi:hypothetical protein